MKKSPILGILCACLVVLSNLSLKVNYAYASDWINPAGGLYDDPSNWSTGVPLPFNDGAVFNLSSPGYTVNFLTPQQTQVLQVINDTVTFDLGGDLGNQGYLINTTTTNSSVILGAATNDIANLTVQNGIFGTVATTTASNLGVRVADFAGTTATLTIDGLGVPGGTSWINIGALTIGGNTNSNGTFNALNGAMVDTQGDVFAGKFDGNSTSTILIDNASWLSTGGTFNVASGDGSTGSLTVQNGGSLTTQTTEFAPRDFTPITNTATALVTGIGSTWQAESLNLGHGSLTVNNGGNVTTIGDMSIGDSFSTVSTDFTVSVDGIGTTMNVGGRLNLGGSTELTSGHLTVSNGAKVTVSSDVSVATQNIGGSDITVTGNGSELNATGWFDVGGALGGTSTDRLTISDGGSVSAGSLGLRTFNNGVIELSGGAINANVGNFNELNASGPAPNVVNGDLTNSGVIKTTDTTLEITGTFTNNGAYISDPSDNIFADLIIDSNGYLVGGEGDRFIVGGDFTNNSTQNALWDTDFATLIFDGAGPHNFTLGSENFGVDGATNNFNWGTMRLESGVSLNLFDADADGAALYAGLFDLADGIDQISLINSPFDIYYDASLAGNAYLAGETIALADGAVLTPGTFPTAVPIPPAFWLFGSGLLGMIGIARRKKA